MNTVLEVPLRQVCTRFLFFCFFLILYIQLNQLILDVRTSKVLRRHLAGFFFFFLNKWVWPRGLGPWCMCHVHLPSWGAQHRGWWLAAFRRGLPTINCGFWSEVGSLDVLVLTYCTAVSLPGEGVKAVRFPGVGKSHTQSRHQWWMENHSSTLIPGGQVYRGDRPNALTIQDDVLGTYTIPGEARGHGPLADMWQRERGSQTPVS